MLTSMYISKRVWFGAILKTLVMIFMLPLQAITPPANAATTGPLPAAAALAAAAVSAKIQAQDAVLGGKLTVLIKTSLINILATFFHPVYIRNLDSLYLEHLLFRANLHVPFQGFLMK